MGQNISRRRWRNLDQGTTEEQKGFLSDWADKFQIVPVSSETRNVKKADHLMVYRHGYTHHLICIKVQQDTVTVMEYGVKKFFDLTKEEVLKSLVDLENLGEVHQNTFTFAQLEAMEMQKIVWPNNLRRYRARKVVRRAKSKEGEKNYDCLTNNCEHFVVWCLCGLSVSLQVKMWYTWAKELVRASLAGTRESVTQVASTQLGSFLLKLLANASDEIAGQILDEKSYAFAIGFAIASIIEGGLCLVEMNQAFEDRENGVIQSDEELNNRILEIVAKAMFRLGFGMAGSVAGSAFGILGSLVGGLVSAAVGHYLGGVVARWYRPE